MNIKRHNLGEGGRREALRTWEIVRERGHKYVGDRVDVGQFEAYGHIKVRTAGSREGSCRGWSVK